MHDPSNTYMHSPEQVDEFDKKKVKRWARIYIVQLKNRDYIRQLLEGNFEEDPELYDFLITQDCCSSRTMTETTELRMKNWRQDCFSTKNAFEFERKRG
jgi:hypothetical protein